MAGEAKVGVIITAQDNMTPVLAGVNKSLTDMRAGLQVTAVVAGVAFAAISAAIVSSIAAANESAAVQAQLGAVLKSTGEAAGVTRQSALDLSTALQSQTTYSDEAVLSAENLLLTFTSIKNDVFPQATQTVLDMATALGEDTSSAAIQLGKALQDPVLGITALRRVGVNFTDSQKDMIQTLVDTGQSMKAQQLILTELNKEFGGSAAAAAGTFEGKMKSLGNQINDVQENIGRAFIPVLDKLSSGIAPVVAAIGNFVATYPNVSAVLLGFAAGITGLLALFATLGLALSVLTPAVIAFGIALAVSLGPITLIAGGLSILAALISQRLNYSYDQATAKSQAMGEQAQELTQRLQTLRTPIEADSAKLADLADKAKQAGQAVADMQQQIADATASHDASQADSKQNIADAAIAQEQKVNDITKQLADAKAQYLTDQQQGMTWKQQQDSQNAITTLQTQLTQEQSALSNFYQQNTDLTSQLTEAKRRASETDFQRQVEDLKKSAANEDAQYNKTVSRLNAQLAALLKNQADSLKAEQDYTASIAAENAKRLADYASTLASARALTQSQPSGVFGTLPSLSFGSSPITSSLFGGFSGSTPSSIHDGIVQNGKVVSTDPDDFLIATKDPSALGGGAKSITINIQGAVMTQDAARMLGDVLLGQLRLQYKL